MCFWKKRRPKEPVEIADKIEVTEADGKAEIDTVLEGEEIAKETTEPIDREKLLKYKKEHPEQFPFTKEWNNRVQAENTKQTLDDTGLFH